MKCSTLIYFAQMPTSALCWNRLLQSIFLPLAEWDELKGHTQIPPINLYPPPACTWTTSQYITACRHCRFQSLLVGIEKGPENRKFHLSWTQVRPRGALFSSLLYSHFTHDCIAIYGRGPVSLNYQAATTTTKTDQGGIQNNESIFTQRSCASHRAMMWK